MYLTQKQLSRRTVLRAAGVTMALPFLEAMVPARASAQAARGKIRFDEWLKKNHTNVGAQYASELKKHYA